MANLVDYVFNNMGRMGNDACENSQRNVLNVKHANYSLKNLLNGLYKPSDYLYLYR